MSLTDDQIVAKNFQKFYEAILPYLNPGVAYFGKNNVYSTDERMIGQWIDEKPLYQKTIDITSLVKLNATYVDVSSLNIDVMVLISAFRIYNNGNCYSIPNYSEWDSGNKHSYTKLSFAKSNNRISYDNTDSDTNYTGGYATLFYTKTTDSAMSAPIGEPNEYSTDEKIVGTWIDGRYIYQRTITGLSLTLSSSWLNVIQNSELNCNQIIFAVGINIINKQTIPLSACVGVNGYVQIHNSTLGNTAVNSVILKYTKIS